MLIMSIVAMVEVLRKVPPGVIERNLVVASNRLVGRPKLNSLRNLYGHLSARCSIYIFSRHYFLVPSQLLQQAGRGERVTYTHSPLPTLSVLRVDHDKLPHTLPQLHLHSVQAESLVHALCTIYVSYSQTAVSTPIYMVRS